MRGVTALDAFIALDLAFQLTRPMRGVTEADRRKWEAMQISTHTPHAGRDRLLKIVIGRS